MLIGHSDGASIALVHAGAGHPVAGIVAIAPHVVVEDGVPGGDRWRRRRTLRIDGHGAAGWPATTPIPTPPSTAGATCGSRPGFRDWDITGHVADISCPVLVVQGEDDDYGTLAQVDVIGSRVRGPFERAVVADAGHSPHLDSPEVVLTLWWVPGRHWADPLRGSAGSGAGAEHGPVDEEHEPLAVGAVTGHGAGPRVLGEVVGGLAGDHQLGVAAGTGARC